MKQQSAVDVDGPVHAALAALHDPAKSNDEKRVLIATALITVLAAFGVSGGTNVVMILTNDPIIKQHKPTLAFASAWIGDGILLPIINVLMMMAFRRWGVRVGRRNSAVALLCGFALMGVFQVVQATQGMTNYTMPTPWKWTWLGYYHMLYMGSQFAYMFFYFITVAQVWPAGKVTPRQKRELAVICGLLLLFGAILQLDYS
jgi:hypothetical protein